MCTAFHFHVKYMRKMAQLQHWLFPVIKKYIFCFLTCVKIAKLTIDNKRTTSHIQKFRFQNMCRIQISEQREAVCKRQYRAHVHISWVPKSRLETMVQTEEFQFFCLVDYTYAEKVLRNTCFFEIRSNRKIVLGFSKHDDIYVCTWYPFSSVSNCDFSFVLLSHESFTVVTRVRV